MIAGLAARLHDRDATQTVECRTATSNTESSNTRRLSTKNDTPDRAEDWRVGSLLSIQ